MLKPCAPSMTALRRISLLLIFVGFLFVTTQASRVAGHDPDPEEHEALCDELRRNPGLGSHCHPSDYVRIEARQYENGQVELALRLWDRESQDWGRRLLPRSRRLPAGAETARWLSTSSLSAYASGDDHVIHRDVRLRARRLADGRVEVGLQVGYDKIDWSWDASANKFVDNGSSYTWTSGVHGVEQALPLVRFVPSEVRGSHWQHSSPLLLNRSCAETSPSCYPFVRRAEPPSSMLDGATHVLAPGIYHPLYWPGRGSAVPRSPHLPPVGNYLVSAADGESCLVSTAYAGPARYDVVNSFVDTVFVTSETIPPRTAPLAELREAGFSVIGHHQTVAVHGLPPQTLTIFEGDFVFVDERYGSCTLTWFAPQP